MGSDGSVAMALHMIAAFPATKPDQPAMPADLLVILDRSGSMNGPKMADACGAIIQLLDRLTPQDRLALVTYASDVRTETSLLAADAANRQRLKEMVNQVRAGGGTNLGGGLQRGIDILRQTSSSGRQRKAILISDGLANQGITDPMALRQMATMAIRNNFSISSVGVGYDFNEELMTALADNGAGRYYFLDNPQAFAQVFEDEFQGARQVVAAGLELRIPLAEGVQLTHAGGYPITLENGWAVVHPGDLLAGQERNLFLTFAVPTDRPGEVPIDRIEVRYLHQGTKRTLTAGLGLKVACVEDPMDVAASVDEKTWTRQVLQEEFSSLKASVADAIRKGEHDAALKQIQAYEDRTRQLNADIGSAGVSHNLDMEVPQLREKVQETFSGSPPVVESKRRQQAKALQYDSYQTRRDQKK
jgi:Ca-activated chloride channel family protein